MAETVHSGAAAHTEVAEHHGPTNFGLDAEGWVYVGLTIFILLAIFVAKAPKKIAAILDQRIADTRRQLDEAKAIRAEAEALLAEVKATRKAASGDAENIVKHAEAEAVALVKKAEADADALVKRRRQMADDKIAAAERQAVEGVRQAAADAATRTARTVIASKLTAAKGKALVDQAIEDLDKRLH